MLARAATDPGGEKRDEFTIGWQQKKTPALGNLLNALEESDLPPDFVPPEAALSELATLLKRAQQNRKEVLGNGLEHDESRELLLTSDIHTAVKLVKRGLSKLGMLPKPAG